MDPKDYEDIMMKITKEDLFFPLLQRLGEHDQIDAFINLLRAVSSGALPVTNIAWKGALYRAKWASCTTTTSLRYDAEYSEFFGILLLLFGSTLIGLLGGPGHYGQVITSETTKGRYAPEKGQCNFAIPCPKTLSKISTGYDKHVQCGIMQQTVDTLKKLSGRGKQFVLSMDGKYVAEGCKGERLGDVDMWGMEGPPTLEETIKLRAALLQEVDHLNSECDLQTRKQYMQRIVNLFTNISKSLREQIQGEFFLRKRIINMITNNPNKAYGYQQSLSRINVNSSDCENLCKRILHVNLELMQHIISCNGLEQLLPVGLTCEFTEQSNMSILRETENIADLCDMDDPDNSIFCKQGSEEWHKLRKMAPITGSTLWRGLGFDTLEKMKNHIKEHVFGRVPAPFTEEATKAMQHGHDFEKHGLASLVSVFLPAMKPACHEFLEVGPVFIPGDTREYLVEVSADGLLHCRNQNCNEATDLDPHGKIAIEIKSPFPNDNIPLQPYYKVPQRHVPQILCEMVGFKTKELWLICATEIAVTVIMVHHSAPVWNKLFAMVKEHYDKTRITLPARLPIDLKKVRADIKHFTYTHCNLIAEIPMIRGRVGLPIDPSNFSFYYPAPDLDLSVPREREIARQCEVLTSECKLLVEESHRVLRRPAKEIVLVMACDKDRKHEDNIPNSIPLAFAMKGKNMNNYHMRKIANQTLDICKANGIHILCMVFDGQWYVYVMFDSKGNPLTRLNLTRMIWGHIRKLTKARCLQEMLDCTRVKQGDMDLMKINRRFDYGATYLNNVTVIRRCNGTLEVKSCGGKLYKDGIVANCRIHKDIYLEDYVQQTNKSTRRDAKVGLQENEENLLSLLDQSVVAEILRPNNMDGEQSEDEDDFLPDIVPVEIDDDLAAVLSSNGCSLLREILQDLQEYSEKKWSGLTTKDIYPDILCNTENLMAECTVKELNLIARAMENHTGRVWFKSSNRKLENCNLITSAFEGMQIEIQQNSQPTKKNVVKSLRFLCKETVEKDVFHPLVVQAAYANAVHSMELEMWRKRAPINLQGYIPADKTCHQEAQHIEYYSYPEFSEERSKIEHSTLDYTHMLTNMRAHILRKGYDYCKSKPFQKVAERSPEIISRALVFDVADKQNQFSAMRMFGCKVEKELYEIGHIAEGQFVKCVREWHEACDMRGITADERVSRLHRMLVFLTKDVDFGKFPSKLVGRYINGMPYQTFDAICQNICTRIQLYEVALQYSYCTRAVSTLPCESMFSDLVRFDREGNGYIKACNVGMILGRVLAINYYKHKPNKSYFFVPTTKGTYPVHVLPCYQEGDGKPSNVYYSDHHFDCVNRLPNKRRTRRADITTGIAPLRGVHGVREWYKINERKINPETRAGLPITNIGALIASKNNNSQ